MAEQKKKGTTLIEKMTVIAIAGIVAAAGVQTYQDYLAQKQVTEAVDLMNAAKIIVTRFYLDQKIWPTLIEFNSLIAVQTSEHVASITPTTFALGFQVTATFNASGVSTGLVNKTIVLATANGLTWDCDDHTINAIKGSLPTIPSKYRPESCE